MRGIHPVLDSVESPPKGEATMMEEKSYCVCVEVSCNVYETRDRGRRGRRRNVGARGTRTLENSARTMRRHSQKDSK